MEFFPIVPGPSRGLWLFFAIMLVILLLAMTVLIATVRARMQAGSSSRTRGFACAETSTAG